MSLIGLTVLPGLTGCSDDSDPVQPRTTVQIVPCARPFAEEPLAATRSWTPPDGYKLYEDASVRIHEWQTNLTNSSITVFFTKADGSQEQGNFFYYGGDSKWRTSVEMEASGVYYLYGFIPSDTGVTASVTAPEGSGFADGAVLTLSGLPTVTPNDICVVVGAKGGTSPETVTGLATGQFAYQAAGNANYIFLLFDHLYSALNFKVKVDADYAKLRTIRLKRMTLKPYNGTTECKASTDVTVTLQANDTGTSPITGTITYTPTAGADTSAQPLFEPADTDGNELTTTEQNLRGCFTPAGITKFVLTSKYDVYDKQENLIRQNCQAENTIDISKMEDFGTTSITRGTMFNIHLTIQPTYLYVLSDPDLDNPTVTLH